MIATPHATTASTTARRFVCAGLRASWDAGAPTEARDIALRGGLDWETVGALAKREALAPLLWTALRHQAWLPADVAAALQGDYQRVGARNMLLLRELETVLTALAPTPVIVLKGAALVEALYGNVALRPMVDLDLLIHPADVERALGAVERLGYQRTTAELRPGATLEFESELMLRKAGPLETQLELHWHLLDSPRHQARMPLTWFWERAVQADLDDMTMLALSPEATLLHLCAHLQIHHRGDGLLWWYDIALLLSRQGGRLDWDEVLRRSAEYDLTIPLCRTLLGLETEGLGVPIDAAVLTRLRDIKETPKARRRFEALQDQPTLGPRRRFLFDLREQTTWTARLRFARAVVFPSFNYMRERYGARRRELLPVYYLIRWVRGLFPHGPA